MLSRTWPGRSRHRSMRAVTATTVARCRLCLCCGHLTAAGTQVLMTRAMREKLMGGGPKANYSTALVRVRMPEGLLLQAGPPLLQCIEHAQHLATQPAPVAINLHLSAVLMRAAWTELTAHHHSLSKHHWGMGPGCTLSRWR